MKHLFIALIAAACAGCAGHKHAVIAHTGTILGLQIAENPSTQLYEVKFGYARSEFAYVPSNRAATEDDVNSGNGASDTPEMLMELRYGNILSRDATLYQRLAVGKAAVSQPGAAFMFAKGKDGTLDAATADAVSRAFQDVPASNAESAKAKTPLGKRFQAATDKAPFEAAAKKHGYASFGAFLIEPSTKPETIKAIEAELP